MNKKGFTLVEMLAVIVILSLLIAVGVPSVLMIRGRMRENQLESKLDLANNAGLVWAKENENCFQGEEECIGPACGFECPPLFGCNEKEGDTKVCRIALEALAIDKILAGEVDNTVKHPADPTEDISHYMVVIEYNQSNNAFNVRDTARGADIRINASWPSTTEIRVRITDVVANGVQYRYYIGGELSQDWTSSNTHTFSGLTEERPYQITVEARNERQVIVGSKTAQIYTSRNVTFTGPSVTGSCPTESRVISGNEIYESITVASPTCITHNTFNRTDYTRTYTSQLQTRTATRTGYTQPQQRTATRTNVNATCRNSACGCEIHQSCVSTACACAQWRSCATSACGCPTWNLCATSACGAKTCKNAACGTSTYSICPRLSVATCAGNGDTQISSTNSASNCPGGSGAPPGPRIDCRKTNTCQHANCGYNSCRTSACGCAAWGSCRTSACGCESYSSCVNANCACATWRNCQHANCGISCPSWPGLSGWQDVSSCSPASPGCALGAQTLRECQTVTKCPDWALSAWQNAESCVASNPGCALGTQTRRDCQTIRNCTSWQVEEDFPRVENTCEPIAQNNTCDTSGIPQTLYRTCVTIVNYTPTWRGVQEPSQKVY